MAVAQKPSLLPVGRGAGALVDVERIAARVVDEGPVVAGVVDLPFLLDVADEAVGVAPGVGGGGLGLLVAAVELVFVGGARGITGVAIGDMRLYISILYDNLIIFIKYLDIY
nr:hypothetical protein [Delftia acidovorans]